MKQAEVKNLKNIGIRESQIWKDYRYNVGVKDPSIHGGYHPKCITEQLIYLYDYRALIEHCLHITDLKKLRTISNRFTFADDKGFNLYYVKRINVADLTVEEAQQIINDNTIMFINLNNYIVEQELIQQLT